MSRESWRVRLNHILHAIHRIQANVRGMNFEQFQADVRAQEAVLWNFTVMGEAVRHLPEHFKETNPDVQWRQVRAMRNFVTHVYDSIKLDIVWATIQDDLSPLHDQIEQLMRRLGETE